MSCIPQPRMKTSLLRFYPSENTEVCTPNQTSLESSCPQIPHPVTACAAGNYILWSHHSCIGLFPFPHSFKQSSTPFNVKKQLFVTWKLDRCRFNSVTWGTADHIRAGLITCVTSSLSQNYCTALYVTIYLSSAHGLVQVLYLFCT